MKTVSTQGLVNEHPAKKTHQRRKRKIVFPEPPQMKDSQWESAYDKTRVLKDWSRFVSHGFKLNHFTKRLYKHLTLHCSFIAHYSLNGFYETYFENPADTLNFMQQFNRKHECRSVEYGDRWWLDYPDYIDINNAMVDYIANILPQVEEELETAVFQFQNNEHEKNEQKLIRKSC